MLISGSSATAGGVLGSLELRQRGHGKPLRFATSVASHTLVRRIRLEGTLSGHRGCVNTVRYSESGRLLLTGSDDCRVGLFDSGTLQPRTFFDSGHHGNIFSVLSVPRTQDCRLISCAADGQVRFHDLEKGVSRRLYQHDGRAHTITVSDSEPNVVVSGGEDSVIAFSDLRVRDGGVPTVLSEFPVNSVQLHPTDAARLLVCGGHAACEILDKRRGSSSAAGHAELLAPPEMLRRHGAHATSAIWSAQGDLVLASYSGGPIYLMDPSEAVPGALDLLTPAQAAGSVVRSFEGHINEMTVKGVSFFGDGDRYVVSGSDCGRVFFWDAASGQCVHAVTADAVGATNCLDPHPMGFPILATSGLEHDAKVWMPTGSEAAPRDRADAELADSGRLRSEILAREHLRAALPALHRLYVSGALVDPLPLSIAMGVVTGGGDAEQGWEEVQARLALVGIRFVSRSSAAGGESTSGTDGEEGSGSGEDDASEESGSEESSREGEDAAEGTGGDEGRGE